MSYVVKGTRVRARWMHCRDPAKDPYSLAGMQTKFEATEREVVGKVTHIYGNHPTNPTKVVVFIQPDDGGPEVEDVPFGSIVEVLD